ncbi:hypothetical protein [Ruminiclostridium papyrosolvens]|uniref:Morphogenetic protein n=1 Tax=Ruminiclostridium papyrosolvens C7 TaxID=1330534 RepID=U4R2A0_9FIRM|nr:hypothetical protein [Ruminiclostridium papyrosolvens]EPR12377.1 hypothetical protein L323_08780 [Ruminiclostridium papyrosolvens C7]
MERPILFNTEMVKAILSGQKTQTRRIVKPQPKEQLKCVIQHEVGGMACWMEENADQSSKDFMFYKSLEVGDILWVRESFWQAGTWTMSYPDDDEYSSRKGSNRYFYVADGTPPNEPNTDYPEGLKNGAYSAAKPDRIWRKFPSIHMPRSAARLFLKVTDVRVERLEVIRPEDIKAEGFNDTVSFLKTWDECYKEPYQFCDNPWVWVIEFERV